MATAYIASDGRVIWDTTGNAVFGHNIAGLANDYASALDQRQSKSANAGDQIAIGTIDFAATNAENGTPLTGDGQFLVWGDNGETEDLETASVPFESAGNGGIRMTRIWRLQNTGVAQDINIEVPLSMVSTDASAGYYLVTADDSSFTTNVAIQEFAADVDRLVLNFTPKAGESFFTIARLDIVTSVDLKDFKASVTGCEANASWIGATESNFDHYELQASIDAVNFETKQTVVGKGSGVKYYASVGLNAATQYLRLKMVDKDGRTAYSDYITVKSNCYVGGSPIAYPNPASSKLNLAHLGLGSKSISLYNASGVRVYTENTSADKMTINVQGMRAGVYLVTITSENGTTVKLKVIIK